MTRFSSVTGLVEFVLEKTLTTAYSDQLNNFHFPLKLPKTYILDTNPSPCNIPFPCPAAPQPNKTSHFHPARIPWSHIQSLVKRRKLSKSKAEVVRERSPWRLEHHAQKQRP